VGQNTVRAEQSRLYYIDNLRWTVIVLVVLMHSAVTYSGIGSWYYTEGARLSPLTKLTFLTGQAALQAFFMGLLFLVAGYFVPGSFGRKGAGRFLKDRCLRLGVPSLIYMLVVHPFTVYCLLVPFLYGSRSSLGALYADYLLSLKVLSGTGPLWFAVALLAFSAVYAAVRAARPKLGLLKPSDPPGDAAVLGLVLAISASAFLIRTVQPIGTSVLNMQLCFFAQYVLLFILGTEAYRRDWLRRLPYRQGVRWLTLALVVCGVTWLPMLLGTGPNGERMDRALGGWHLESAAYCLWESLFCVGVCLGLIVLYRERLNRQGPLAKLLSDNAFAVYVFHTPVLVALALAARGIAAPPLVKFALLSMAGLLCSFALCHLLLRRLPGLRSVL
jgi:surface polysaccharide O-acyltransferase-like enzyme